MAVVDCFPGQPLRAGAVYRIDPGRDADATGQVRADLVHTGFKNADVGIPQAEVLKNIQAMHQAQNVPLSEALKRAGGCDFILDVEMETGTGKTYCYIKTMFKMKKRSWSWLSDDFARGSSRPVGFGRNGLWEGRSDLSGGRIAIVLLHGFLKKTQKTPKQDLQLAFTRRKEMS